MSFDDGNGGKDSVSFGVLTSESGFFGLEPRSSTAFGMVKSLWLLAVAGIPMNVDTDVTTMCLVPLVLGFSASAPIVH